MQHFDSWTPPYDPTDRFSSIFGRTITIRWGSSGRPVNVTNPTLLQALDANGGGINALARSAVAALLNAASLLINPTPAFDTPAEVIAAFQAAFDSGSFEALKNQFDASNNAGCPLN
jgi:hypothetical protein